jgi:hypothetical protein
MESISRGVRPSEMGNSLRQTQLQSTHAHTIYVALTVITRLDGGCGTGLDTPVVLDEVETGQDH